MADADQPAKNIALYDAVEAAYKSAGRPLTLAEAENLPEVKPHVKRAGHVKTVVLSFEKKKSLRKVKNPGPGVGRVAYEWSQKTVTQNEKLLDLISKEPGIPSTALRARAEELGMTPDSVSQALYVMEKAGKVHYGEGASGRNRPCFVGPAKKGTRALPTKATLKNRPSAKSEKATPKSSKGTRTVQQSEGTPYAVFPAPAKLSPAILTPLADQVALMPLVSQDESVNASIANFAAQVAATVARSIATQVQEQLQLQVVQQVSEAIANQMAQFTQSISGIPGMPGTSAAPGKRNQPQENPAPKAPASGTSKKSGTRATYSRKK
jgi:hypothetical protein